jgi:hypothetical protein
VRASHQRPRLAILTLISIMFLASGSWNSLIPSLDNPLNLLFGLLDSVFSLSVGLSVVAWVCSRVTLEAASNKVGLVLVTRFISYKNGRSF